MTLGIIGDRIKALAVVWCLTLAGAHAAGWTELEKSFLTPPASARPWVYWFWNNGNVTRAGITADLEAMHRAGIGGVIIMDVVERFAPPPGTADFMSSEWQELFRFAVTEAHRLGIEINMTNGPGWCGSSGPWITPEFSMQTIVTTNLTVAGPARFAAVLPQPRLGQKGHDDFNSTVKYDEFYRDIAVLAFAEPTNGIVAPAAVLNLTGKLEANGQLNWEVPAGKWIVVRLGHTTTGSSTRPPVKGGNGLECDKLSRAAMDVHFTNLLGRLITGVGKLAGSTLSATHIDSWEVGGQNWTPQFREEFRKRRGYDPVPFLPNLAGLTTASGGASVCIGDAVVADRFRWDFQQTLSELLAENYVGRLAELAHQHGLRLSIEGYDLPFGDEATYTARADEPMSEFWATGGNQNAAKGRQMASVAHIMGKQVVGAEAFTADDHEQWKMHPATVKALGDFQFCQGINRFVIHRYAHQPYLDRFPGATMGPWGLHYERTQTWWEMSGAWHQYLGRCQFMLRQGLFVADLCYLRPQLPNQTYFTPEPPVPDGYKYDECSAEALMSRMSVKDGRLVLPDGMSYRVLVLPAKATAMTPALVRKVMELVAAGATVVGPRPTESPSLSGFPQCDDEVAGLAAEVWGKCDGRSMTESAFGKGRVVWGRPLEQVLEKLKAAPDFAAGVKLNWIHRRIGQAEIYFVANEAATAVEVNCQFRVKGLLPELWNPETGGTSPLAMWAETPTGISVPLRLEARGAVFVVFRQAGKPMAAVLSFLHDGQPVVSATRPAVIKILKATYGVPGDAARTRDVQAKVQRLAERGEVSFPVSKMAEGDDPAYGTVKTLLVEYTIDNQFAKLSGQDPDPVSLLTPVAAPVRAAEVRCDPAGRLKLVASQPGRYEVKTVSGQTRHVEFAAIPASLEITGGWDVHFPSKWGAPDQIVLDQLRSLSESTNAGVKFFSGTATYTKVFIWDPVTPAKSRNFEHWLDLGDVQVMAQVKLNGRDLGPLWQPPFRMDITTALKPGRNTLEVRVANLWPNRMIGDAALPPAERFTWSSYEPFTKDSPLPKSGLLGPVTIKSAAIVNLP
ncbi:MAG: glycosyl hydrolase [Verrucomicrobiota bacterium]